jgi:CheY-like chemotaxis protein
MPKDVIIVDDDTAVRAAICDVLHEVGYAVAAFENGRTALEYLRDGNRPSLILLDLMMPVMDGWAFLCEKREDPRLAAIPVAVLSAAGIERLPADVPADHFLRKPFQVSPLLDLVARTCTGH